MSYLNGFGTDFYYWQDVGTGEILIFPETYDPNIYNPGAYTNKQFAYSDTVNPPAGSGATDFLTAIPILGNFLVQTGIVRPIPKATTPPPPGGFKTPSSPFVTYAIIGGLGLAGILLIKTLVKK